MVRALFWCVMLVSSALAARLRAEGLEQKQWQVGNETRQALVAIPAAAKNADSAKKFPLVFVFHGHGGTARHAARSMHIHETWPEAICVYPQGLNTPGKLTDPEGKKSGWQHSAGDQDDRDLKFFDTMLADLAKSLPVDQKRVFSTGHSNGGGFTYLLWSERGDKLAAVAPSASAALGRLGTSLKPKPVFHLAGENDPLVRYSWQEQTIKALVGMNKCDAASSDWVDGMKVYRSADKTPVVVYLHQEGHKYPARAPAMIVRFFKEYSEIPARSAP